MVLTAAAVELDSVLTFSDELIWHGVADVALDVAAAGAAAVLVEVAAGGDEAWVADGTDATASVEELLLLPRGFSPTFRFDSVSAEIDDSFALLPESRLWLMLGAASLDDV